MCKPKTKHSIYKHYWWTDLCAKFYKICSQPCIVQLVLPIPWKCIIHSVATSRLIECWSLNNLYKTVSVCTGWEKISAGFLVSFYLYCNVRDTFSLSFLDFVKFLYLCWCKLSVSCSPRLSDFSFIHTQNL